MSPFTQKVEAKKWKAHKSVLAVKTDLVNYAKWKDVKVGWYFSYLRVIENTTSNAEDQNHVCVTDHQLLKKTATSEVGKIIGNRRFKAWLISLFQPVIEQI